MNSEMTILVNSCDKYSDIWDVYFEMLYVKWPDCPYQIILNTETLNYKSKWFDVKVINLPNNVNVEQVSWTDRLINVLEQIDSKYTLVTLDDIYFLNSINNDEVNELLRKIDRIKRFAMLYFYNFGPKYHKRKLGLDLCHRYCDFNYNITCNLWKTEELQKVLLPGETPWEAEQTIKKMGTKSKCRYYCVAEKQYFQFNVSKYGLIQGKWAKPSFDLFEENGIVFTNESNRELYTHNYSDIKRQQENEWQQHLLELEHYSRQPYFFYSLRKWREWIPSNLMRLMKMIKSKLRN